MLDREDPQLLWVSPDAIGGNGTYDNPFSDIESALKKVKPGSTIVLQKGIYDDDLTIQISGSVDKPIRISADDNAEAVISKGCWFFYDASDFIVSGLTFKDAPHGAISVIGSCNRNRFENCVFIDCGTAAKETCTVYFGGADAECNMVDNCQFTRSDSLAKTTHTAIGIMISDSVAAGDAPIRRHIIRKNTFSNYTHAILVGSESTQASLRSHIVEYNTITKCSADAILVKCGDTHINGNLIKNCTQTGIRIVSGQSNIAENNRIERCATGIAVNGMGHALHNNCIIDSEKQGVIACRHIDNNVVAAVNLFIENNTCVSTSECTDGIVLEAGSSGCIMGNLTYGYKKPLVFCTDSASADMQQQLRSSFVIDSNAAFGSKETPDGFQNVNISFNSKESGNFENSSPCGAQGWPLKPQGFNPDIDAVDSESSSYLDVYDLDEIDDEEPVETADADDDAVDQKALFESLFGNEARDDIDFPGVTEIDDRDD